MANQQRPAGLVPSSYLSANPWTGQSRLYYIPSSDANAYAVGDPVKTLSGGADANGVSGVVLATAGDGNAIRGVIVGVGTFEGLMANPASLDTIIIPATKTKAYYVMVVDDPNVIFEIQSYQGSYTAADIGKNCNLKSGTNNGYVSGWTLDDTAVSTTASTRQLKLLGLARRSNNAFGAYATFLVKINNHELAGGTAGV